MHICSNQVKQSALESPNKYVRFFKRVTIECIKSITKSYSKPTKPKNEPNIVVYLLGTLFG